MKGYQVITSDDEVLGEVASIDGEIGRAHV